MRTIRFWLKLFLVSTMFPATYVVFSLMLGLVPVNGETSQELEIHTIFLSSNGVHLDIVVPVTNIDIALSEGLRVETKHKFVAFGWGDKDFYINVPTWDKLSFSVAIKALFLESECLMHVSRFENKGKNWTEVKVTKESLRQLNACISKAFRYKKSQKRLLEGKGYSSYDDFYMATGSYSLFNTCNTWVNSSFRNSGIKACLWTPFDFSLLNLHHKR